MLGVYAQKCLTDGVWNQNSLESTGLELGEALQAACQTTRCPVFLTTTAEYPRHMQTSQISSDNESSCTSKTEVRLHC